LGYLEDTVPGRDIVLLDVGGYFAPTLHLVAKTFSGRLLGVVEDTENGHQRYAALDEVPCPVVSVARSPLKECEDHLVGRSIVFSTEALVRSRGDILTSREACVIGYGKVGRSIARALHAHDLRVTVYDTDPVKRVQAMAQGFRRRTPVGDHLTRFDVIGHYFYLLADGGAVNFLHGGVVGTFIHLVQAEILTATGVITSGELDPGITELHAEHRQVISRAWLDSFTR
jgi:adenosylhomocysteinase